MLYGYFPQVAFLLVHLSLLEEIGTSFRTYYGIDYNYNGGSTGLFPGDDAIELFYNTTDVFGDINTDGSGQAWDYLDGWAYRKSGGSPTNF